MCDKFHRLITFGLFYAYVNQKIMGSKSSKHNSLLTTVINTPEARNLLHFYCFLLSGTLEESILCDKVTGECTCKVNVEGRSCNQCKANAYNLTLENFDGCEACGCDPTGTVSGDILPQEQLSCDHNTGQCTCLSGRSGQKCDECEIGEFMW